MTTTAPVTGPTQTTPAMSPCLPPDARKLIEIANAEGTAQEVNQAREAIASLSPAEKKALFNDLIKNDPKALEKFAHEMVDSASRNGGISLDKQREFFVDIAKNLTGEQLAAVEQAFVKADKGTVNSRSLEELSQAIARHSTSEVKADFIAALAPKAADQTSTDITPKGWVSDSIYKLNLYDPEARAISVVLSSFADAKSLDFGKAMSALEGKSTLEAVINASMMPTYRIKPSGAEESKFDLKQFEALSKIMEGSKNTIHQASFIKATGAILPDISDKNSRAQIANAMSRIFDRDTVGIISVLAAAERGGGDTFANYAEVMLKDVKGGELQLNTQIKNFVNSRPLNGPSHSTMDLFTKMPDSTMAKDRAMDFGYMLGSVSKAFSNINAGIDRKRELAAAIFNDVLGPFASAAKVTGANTGAFLLADAIYKNEKDLAMAFMNEVLQKGQDKILPEYIVSATILGHIEDGMGLVGGQS